MIVDARGNLLYGMYGPNPHPFPTAFNSELLAVIMLLRRATAPLVVHTDNQAVIDGWRAGKRRTTASSNASADLWRDFWFCLEAMGPGVSLVKVKGHATEQDVDEGRSTNRHRRANGHADTFAVRGTDVAEDMAPTNAKLYDEARAWYGYLLTLSGDWKKDATPYEDWHVVTPEPPPLSL